MWLRPKEALSSRYQFARDALVGRSELDGKSIPRGEYASLYASRDEGAVRHLWNEVTERGVSGEMAVDDPLQPFRRQAFDRTKGDDDPDGPFPGQGRRGV